jgi:C-terminal peptidase prc
MKSTGWFVAAFFMVGICEQIDRVKSPVLTISRPGLSEYILELSDLVLTNHINPPARQQMVLAAAKSVLAQIDAIPSSELSRGISEISARADLLKFLDQLWANHITPEHQAEELQQIAAVGLLNSVPGEPQLSSAKEHRVEEQLAANRYVGIGVALGYDEKENCPRIMNVFKSGPAFKQGLKDRDFIIEINGTATHEMRLVKAVDQLRGPAGTKVKVKIRTGDSSTRDVEIERGIVPLATLFGVDKSESDGSYRIKRAPQIGYVRVENIRASTLHELKQITRKLEQDGVRSLILDLRYRGDDDFHSATLLADGLAGEATIGKIRKTDRVQEIKSSIDQILRDWKLALLIDGTMSSARAWIANILDEDPRVKTFGHGMIATDYYFEAVSVPGSDDILTLPTGLLERADGKPLLGKDSKRVAVADALSGNRWDRRVIVRQLKAEPEHRIGTPADPATPNAPDAPADRSNDPILDKAVEWLTPTTVQ